MLVLNCVKEKYSDLWVLCSEEPRLQTIFGDPKDSGDIYINGNADIKSQDAVNNGIGCLQRTENVMALWQRDVAENSTMACLDNFINGIFNEKEGRQ